MSTDFESRRQSADFRFRFLCANKADRHEGVREGIAPSAEQRGRDLKVACSYLRIWHKKFRFSGCDKWIRLW